MSSAQFNAGQTHGQAQGKTEEWIDSAKSTANAAHDKACDAAGKTKLRPKEARRKMLDSFSRLESKWLTWLKVPSMV
ncbi:hypothetical protein DH2020_019761 [Rehmannia glutinosa]|uniref:Late embryogenesis abundant protein n=1 Tax=Rehmannia glutinosa TaxID=99300 RepID=A0ABR0WE60_REHGL